MKPKYELLYWLGCGCFISLLALSIVLWMFTLSAKKHYEETQKICEPYQEDDLEHKPGRCGLNFEVVTVWGAKIVATGMTSLMVLEGLLWLLSITASLVARRRQQMATRT